jgi:RimJ/RimL family protein N-acetyltransferase
MVELTTARLVLRPLATADASALHQLWIAPGVRRFLWDDEVIPLTRTLDVIATSEQLFREHRFGLWAAWRTDAVFALSGFGGIWPFRDPPVYELLYGVAESAWGSGYATEIARAVCRYGFDELKMSSIRASTDVGNTASIHVLEKLGFVCVARNVVDDLDTLFFEATNAGERTMEPTDLVVVSTFRTTTDAQVAKGILDEVGIESTIRADDAGGMYPTLSETQLIVRAEDATRATEALNRRRRRHVAED